MGPGPIDAAAASPLGNLSSPKKEKQIPVQGGRGGSSDVMNMNDCSCSSSHAIFTEHTTQTIDTNDTEKMLEHVTVTRHGGDT